MSSIYQGAVKRPITTILIFVALAVLGIFSLSKLPIDLYPKIDTGNIIVMTTLPGAGPQDIETNLTNPIENTLNGVANVKHITSQSRENISVVNLEFNEGTDIDAATNDVRDKLGTLNDILPEEAHQPMIFKFGLDDIPILFISATAKESAMALGKILDDRVVNALAKINGVGAINYAGAVQRQIQVYCDPAKLEAYGITLQQVASIIGAENSNIPAGQIDVGSQTNSLRVQGEFTSPDQLNDIVLTSRAGQNVYLRDVARVEDTSQERIRETYLRDGRGAMIFVNKQSGANSVEIARKVKAEMERIRPTLPSDVQLDIVSDSSDFIINSVNNLKDTIFITFFVVMLVVLLFLGRWRATFIIVLTIPLSLVSSFIYLMITGGTLNIISMSSISIAIGMVVDDAIVVLENITTHIERGSYPSQAAVHATNEVAISVFASTLTLLAVFLPLTMVGGMAGIMFRQLGWIVSIVMIISLLCAILLTPTLCSLMLRRNKGAKRTLMQRFADGMLQPVERFYLRSLRFAVSHRAVIIVSAVVIFGGSLFLARFIHTEFMPQGDNSYLKATVEYPLGTSIDVSRKLGMELKEKWLAEHPEIKSIGFSVGQADASNSFGAMGQSGSHLIDFTIALTDPGKRKQSVFQFADNLRDELSKIPGLERYNVSTSNMGNMGSGVNIELYGYDFAATDEIARKVMDGMMQTSSCAAAINNRQNYMPEYNMHFDRQKLAENGLNLSSAAFFLRNAVNGALASYYREDGKEYEIRVRLAPEARRSLEDIGNILVYSPKGKAIRLSELGTIEELYTPPTIYRKDRQRCVTIACTPKAGVPLSTLVNDARKVLNNVEFPGGYSYKLAGSFEQQQESFADMTILLLLIVFLVYIVMAAQFESLYDPFVVMFSVPFAFTGVILGLLLTRTTLSLIALIGAIMLVGIVVKNGIVLIDYTRLARERGASVRSAVLIAGKSRLRPVLMTTLTTVLGMVPMALGIGQGSEMWQPMGVTVAFGLTISTLVTLILIPTLYTAFSGGNIRRKRHNQMKKFHKNAIGL